LWLPKSSSETYNLEEDESVKPINYLYVGLFDGHGGPGCALKASKGNHSYINPTDIQFLMMWVIIISS
jgi:serine/threonine protein phosphatase PrpC